MKKTFAKIIGATLGIAMAVGVGASVVNNNGFGPLYATDAELSISDYASANSWTNGTAYQNITVNSYIALTSVTGGNNCKYYTTNHSWRHYEGDSGAITINATNATLTSATFTYDNGNSGVLKYGGNEKTSGTAISLSGTSATFTVAHSSGTKNGNVQITSMSISYTINGGGGGGSSSSSSSSVPSSSSSSAAPVTYTVTYHDNNKTSGSAPSDAGTYEEGAVVTVKGNPGSLVRTGYDWFGWSLNSDGSGTAYGPAFVDKYTVSTSNIDFYPIWAEKPSIPSYDGELAFHFAGSTVSTASGYDARSATVDTQTTSKYDSATWQITVGNSTAQLGTNAAENNLSKATLGNGSFGAASGLASALGIQTSTQKYSAAICTTPMTNIYDIDLIFTGTNGGAITSAWVLSSTNGTTWEVEARKVWGITTGSSFSFLKNDDARQYAFVAYWNLTNSGGLKGFELKMYGKYPLAQTITASADSAYTDQTITLTTNAASAAWTITANTAGASLSTASAKSTVVTPTQAGSVTVQAVADGYLTTTKTVSFSVRPVNPFITPAENSTGGYSGQNVTMSFTYGNLTGSLNINSEDEAVATVETPVYSAGSGTVQINFIGAGTTDVKFKDGSTEKASVSVTVTASTVTITGLAASDAICVGETLDLGSTISVEAVGSYSDDVIWDSDDDDIAEVSVDGVVTGVSAGTVDITVYAYSDLDVYMTCSVTVSESNFVRVNKFQNGKKYIIAAEGNTDSSKLFYLPAASEEKASNPAAVEITTFADLTEANAWTATITVVSEQQHIVFSNTVEATTYYLAATNKAQGIKVVTDPGEGYWTFDGTGLRYNDGGSRYLYTYTDSSFRYYDENDTGRTIADVFYRYSPSGPSKNAIENLSSLSSLSYRYSEDNGNYTYSNVAIRFGAMLSQDLWESLDAESNIQGYGVILSTETYLNGDSIKGLYDIAYSGDVDDAMDELCEGGNVKNFYTSLTSKGATHPDEANAAQKGALEGTYYVWNLYKHVLDSQEGLTANQIKTKLMRNYVAVAYIRTANDGIIFFDEITASVKSLAQDLIDDDSNGLTAESLEGSLGNLAGLTA